jgi:hypothetical protein
MSHRIRLRGFWQRTADGYTRAFGRPTAGAVFRLAGETAAADGTCSLNGRELGRVTAGAAFAFDVTALLLARNSLHFTGSTEPGECWLEIDPDEL